MNSLVVLFSVLVLAAAKPSGVLLGGPLLSYSAPAAAVSQQSRIDIKSSPAIIATAAVAPISRTVIAEPAFVAAPAAIAPAAVSHQSRIDIKSSPAVVSAYAAAPVAYAAAPIATAAIAPTIIDSATSPALLNTAYAAPAAYAAPGIYAPATAIAGPIVPLDTPEVIAARAAHFEAKALAGTHLIGKRSAPIYASPLISPYAASPLAYSPAIAHIAPLTPLTYSAPIITKGYGIHPW